MQYLLGQETSDPKVLELVNLSEVTDVIPH